MSRKLFTAISVLLIWSCVTAFGAAAPMTAFPVAAHEDVNIEWWYFNAHVTTSTGRHLAVVGSFFRSGNGKSPFDQTTPQHRSHYLIYAVSDLDRKVQRSYSIADTYTIDLLKQFAPFAAAAHPSDPETKKLLKALESDSLPSPHQKMTEPAVVRNNPFFLSYGPVNTVESTNLGNTAFTVNLGAGGGDKLHLTFDSRKPPMAVGGQGETGLNTPADMHYFSLTRCGVGGTVDTGHGAERIAGGSGWIDHQYGNSWLPTSDGWDWWGIQLDNGTDILVYRHRDPATGKVRFPLATFMDRDGRQSVTRKITFAPDPHAIWTSPRTGARYPLGWTLSFAEKGLRLGIRPDITDQEMPILGPGGNIWEGSCRVDGFQSLNSHAKQQLTGVAYMELVGYGSPAASASLGHK